MKNKILSITLAVFMVFASIVMPLTQVKAAGTEKTTVLTIHKLKYEGNLDNDKLIKNDGTEQTYDASYKPYDAEEYGKVGLTLYKLDKDKLIAKLKQENGDSKKVAADIASDITGNTTNGTISKTEIAETFIEGKNPIQMTVTTKGEVEYFLLVETTSPATVAEKSSPELLQFPTMNVDGKGYNLTPHIYLKSKVDETSRELEFNKVVLKVAQDGTVDATTKFEGADFEVYKGKPGAGEKLMKDGNAVKLTSNAQGTFKITGLTVGNYYLVEVASDKVDSLVSTEAKSTAKNYIASIDAKNDANNKYAFRMDEDGHIYKITGWNEDTATTNKGTEYNAYNEKLPSIKNTIKPSTSKKLASKAGTIGYSDVLDYEIDVNIPANFGKNSDNEKLIINDKITEGAIINTDSFKVYDKEGNERANAQLTIAKVSDNEVNITVDKNTIKTDGDNISYKPIVIKYTVKLSKDFAVNGDIEIKNNITSKYTVGGNEFDEPENPANPENPDEPTSDKNKEVIVRSYTKKFKKIDSGIFNKDVNKAPLKGAEFILGRKIGDKVEYRKEDATDKYAWTETEADAQVLTSGEDGTFEAEGLAATTSEETKITYFVKEIKAPQYYNLPEDDKDRTHEFSFDGTKNEVLEISNDKISGTPMTGREVAAIKIAGLSAILLIVGIAFVATKFKKAKVTR